MNAEAGGKSRWRLRGGCRTKAGKDKVEKRGAGIERHAKVGKRNDCVICNVGDERCSRRKRIGEHGWEAIA